MPKSYTFIILFIICVFLFDLKAQDTTLTYNSYQIVRLQNNNGIYEFPYTPLDSTQWHSIAWTKSSNLDGKVYIDGELVFSGRWENVPYNYTQLLIGSRYYNFQYSVFYEGLLDEVRISNKVRTAQEILTAYTANQQFINDANTIALWHFNETGGTTFSNSATAGSGTLYNGAMFVPGKFGNGVSFDGINDRGNCFFNMPESNVSVEFWIKPKKLTGGSVIEPNGDYNSGFRMIQKTVTVPLNSGKISGIVYKDDDANCTKAIGEQGIPGQLLKIEPGDIYATTNSIGEYTFYATPDTYNVELVVDTFRWNQNCPSFPNTISVIVESSLDTILNRNFALTYNNSCPDLRVDISNVFLRPCFSNNLFYIHYCNDYEGTGTALNTYIDVKLDPALTPINSNLSWVGLGANSYRFSIGDIPPGNCDQFWIQCQLDCDVPIGITLCNQATIYPIDSCALINYTEPDTNNQQGSLCGEWDKSSLRVDGFCVGDSIIRFIIYNTGIFIGGDMDCYRPIRIYVDNQLIEFDSLMIVGGDSLVFDYPADGRTWRLEADQHPLHPGNSHPNAVVEACGDSITVAQNWTPNLVNTMPQNDIEPVTDIDCTITTLSFDPNDKKGFPLGVTANNYIKPNTDLEYIVRFQNTGTDTAFNIVVLDTLANELDITTVEEGAASHSYEFRIYGKRILEWRFDNIMLPDSNTNESMSHGFLSFKVCQTPNLPNGTLINNKASIYFDFNAPIITNLSNHIVYDTTILSSTTVIKNKEYNYTEATLYPNPSTGKLSIVANFNIEFINIFSIDGREVLSKTVDAQNNKTELNLDSFPQGLYIVTISTTNGRVSKKLIIQH